MRGGRRMIPNAKQGYAVNTKIQTITDSDWGIHFAYCERIETRSLSAFLLIHWAIESIKVKTKEQKKRLKTKKKTQTLFTKIYLEPLFEVMH